MNKFAIIAFRNLLAHRNRNLILGGAIAVVTALLVFMMALTSGIKAKMVENATALSTGHVNVGGFLKISQTSSAPILNHATKLRAVINDAVPEASLISERVRAFGKIISDSSSIMVPMTGINMANERSILGDLQLAPKSEYVENFVPRDGEALVDGNLADLERQGHIVVFASHAKKLGIRVGDIVTVSMPTYRNIYNTKDVKVAAILRNLGMISSFSVFLHDQDTREIYDMAADTTGVFQIYLPSLSSVPEVEDRLRKSLAAAKYELMDKDANPFWMKFDRVAGESWTGQRLDVTTWEDETSFLKWIVDLFNALTFALIFVLMAIVVIGLVNNMWMAIRERTAEIGTMRAVGLQRRDVIVMFLLESLFLSTASVGLGILVGSAVAVVVNALEVGIESEAFVMFLMANTLSLEVHVSTLVAIFITLCSLLMIGSFFPAYRASKMKPITAINHVN